MTNIWDEREAAKREAARADAHAKAEPWLPYLRLLNYGNDVPAFRRLREAWWAIREQRRVNNYKGGDYEQEILAVRVVAETMAMEVQAAAGNEQDSATVAWVVAGLRCPSRPFCTGCSACFTIASPNRPNDPPAKSAL